MLNKVILIGRLCADPIFKMTPNTGTPVTTFTLAVDRMDKDKSADFINIIVWNKQAENCAQYLAKGSLCAVDGRLTSRKYETKDNQKRTVWEVVAKSVQFLGGKKDDGKQEETPQTYPGHGTGQYAMEDEDVPFND